MTILVVITEGRKHIVRRLCKGVRLKLKHLHRTRIANLTLEHLKPGDYYYLSDKQAEDLWSMSGGKDVIATNQIIAALRLNVIYERNNLENKKLAMWINKYQNELSDVLSIIKATLP